MNTHIIRLPYHSATRVDLSTGALNSNDLIDIIISQGGTDLINNGKVVTANGAHYSVQGVFYTND